MLDDSFAELAARTDLPEFDIITIHGIWSWVSDENRRHIVDIIRRKLAVGGVVYLSYNCSQGWANSVPLRQLMFLHSRLATGKAEGIVAQINSAMGFTEKLIASGAQHFKNNPMAAKRLEVMKERPRQYVAHELFNADWQPMMFSEVAELIDNAKIAYVGPGKLLEYFDSINLTSQQQTLLNEIPDTVLKETVRDFCMDRSFRTDLYVKGPYLMSLDDRLMCLRGKRFILTTPLEGFSMTVQGALGEGKLKEEIYQPIINLLASANYTPKSVIEMERSLDSKEFPASTILESLLILTGAGRAALAQDDDVVSLVEPRTRALNRHLMDRAQYSESISTVASPVTGGGIMTNRIAMLFLRAVESGETTSGQWAMSTWAILARQGHRLLKDGKPMEKAEDNIEELNKQAKEFGERLLPVFRALKVV